MHRYGMSVVQELSKSIHNRPLVEKAGVCGCYKCCKLFEAAQVKEWTYDETAICPLCGVDAVIPGIGESELKALNKYLFA